MIQEEVFKALEDLKIAQFKRWAWYKSFGLPISEEEFENNSTSKAIKLLEQLIEDETNNS